jgi:UDP-2,4-diacetamido-2,4,6-trideoxy-beta-L-altropyranose hydrolase
MGLPSLTIILAENQRAIAETLHSLGIAQNLGWHSNQTPQTIATSVTQLLCSLETRTIMAQRGQTQVDGEGSSRVLTVLTQAPLQIRKARPEDCELLWYWANEPTTRSYSFSSRPITWAEHTAWFERKMKDPNCLIYIGIKPQNIPMGQIRFDRQDNYQAEISISLVPHERGCGHGRLLIEMALDELFRHTPVYIVHAHIKPQNIASIRAFEKAGFQRLDDNMLNGNEMGLHYCKMKDKT